MGAGFSSSRRSSSPQKLPKKYLSDQNSVLASSIINFMKPRCLWTDEENKQHQPVNEAKLRTLEEWLLASPSLNKNSSSGGEYYVFKNFSPKVHFHRSLYADKADYTSNSLEGLLKLDEVEKEELRASSQSGKTKKRVRFKLPEEADIFIFYSPAEDEFLK